MMMGSGLILMLLLSGLVAYALGWRPQFNQNGPAQTSRTPVEILNARYARGEISREEYEQMRRDLEGRDSKSILRGEKPVASSQGRPGNSDLPREF